MNELNTYQFPPNLVTRFQNLMNSKESFLENLSDADRRRLQTSYARLTDAWNQNRTEQQLEHLTMQSEELKKKEANSRQTRTNLEAESRKNWQSNLELKKQRLTEAEQICQRKVSALTTLSSNWKKDIKQREERLKQSKATLAEESSSNEASMESLVSKEREKQSELLNEKRTRLKTTSQRKNEILQAYKKEWKRIERTFAQKKETSDLNHQQLVESLTSLKKDMRKYFGEQIAIQIPNCPNELRELLTSGEWLTISLKANRHAPDLAGLEKALTRELTKLGINPSEFLRQFDLSEKAAAQKVS